MRDYAEQIARLRECASNNHEVHLKCGAYLSGVCAKTRDIRMQDAADAIEELLAEKSKLENSGKLLVAAFDRLKEKVPHWISVEERLPDVAEKVLTYNGDFVSENWLCTVASKVGRINVWAYSEGFVTHWMPLPKAPKEVK